MSQIGSSDNFTDPVSHVTARREDAAAKSFYNGTEYLFADRVNKAVFDENPGVWVSSVHASVTSADYLPLDNDTP